MNNMTIENMDVKSIKIKISTKENKVHIEMYTYSIEGASLQTASCRSQYLNRSD